MWRWDTPCTMLHSDFLCKSLLLGLSLGAINRGLSVSFTNVLSTSFERWSLLWGTPCSMLGGDHACCKCVTRVLYVEH